MLTIALPTGRVFSQAAELIRRPAAIEELSSPGQRLVIEEEGIRYILAKPTDVLLYVGYGTADLASPAGMSFSKAECPLWSFSILSGRCSVAVGGPRPFSCSRRCL
ncbi:hypothetical protein MASR2M17_02840 [Aminivibrio sp.]